MQMDIIGVGSLMIVVLVSFASGLDHHHADGARAAAIWRDRPGGTDCGHHAGARIGTAADGDRRGGPQRIGIASELGSMKVTEQIDAMRALGTDPIQKLVKPRMIAIAIMLPC